MIIQINYYTKRKGEKALSLIYISTYLYFYLNKNILLFIYVYFNIELLHIICIQTTNQRHIPFLP